ncbi:MAG: hypothetical protein A2297_03045 [Elusimicrobia bacterium RIFOXYB2_FULL_48_7]|nr:MAG: hypothetical protein A2297_03045 [Elusimicrobia bacterium RIFOXYB2_FULL_48_7]
MPGTVTVGGVNYTDTGTRTWAFADKYDENYIQIDTTATAVNVTLACFLTPGPTVFVWNQFDTISIGAVNPNLGYARHGLLQIIYPNVGGPFMRGHSSDTNGATTFSASSVTVVTGKTYWVNVSLRGVTNEVLIAVFDPDNGYAQVGETVSCPTFLTTGIVQMRGVKLGRSDSHSDNPKCGTQTNFDHLMVDYTNGVFPLLPDISTGTDTTPPSAPGTVRDGLTSGIDISSTTSTTQLSANWTAATDAQSVITAYQYAIGTSAGGTQALAWQTLGNVLTVTRSGLSLNAGTTYYFTVRGVSAGGTGTAANSNGQVVSASIPADTTPPVISLVTAQNITAYGAVITWTTDELSTTQVEYGRTINYGHITIKDLTMALSHSVTLANLQDNAGYYFRVISGDAGGNETVSQNYTFSTPEYVNWGPATGNHAYPNPCRVSSMNQVRFRMPDEAAGGEVAIYTLSGQLVRKRTGQTVIFWDGSDSNGEKAGRGIYIYKITSNAGATATGKIVLK